MYCVRLRPWKNPSNWGHVLVTFLFSQSLWTRLLYHLPSYLVQGWPAELLGQQVPGNSFWPRGGRRTRRNRLHVQLNSVPYSRCTQSPSFNLKATFVKSFTGNSFVLFWLSVTHSVSIVILTHSTWSEHCCGCRARHWILISTQCSNCSQMHSLKLSHCYFYVTSKQTMRCEINI